MDRFRRKGSEKQVKLWIGIYSVAILFLSIMTISPSYADTILEIYLVPSANDFTAASISLGYMWNITALVKNIPEVNATLAYQLKLSFNASIFEVSKAWIPK